MKTDSYRLATHTSSAYARLGRESRQAGVERRRAFKAVARAAVQAATATPRLVKVERQLQVIPLAQFLATPPQDEVLSVVQADLPATGRKRRAYELDAVLSEALREAF